MNGPRVCGIDANDNNGLFSVQPSLSTSTGTLTYTLAPDANGSALVTAVLTDGGGTANGGVNHVTHTFTITVTPVNQPPSFVKGPDQTLHEEGTTPGDGPVVTQTVVGWSTGFSPGPANESGQTVLAYAVVTNDHPLLFSVQPAVSTIGTLTYELAANRNGTAHIGITFQDNCGTANGGVDTSAPQTLTITVTGVDHPPAAINDFPTIAEGSGPTTINVLANDTDPDGDPLTIIAIPQQGTRGIAAIAKDHLTVTYKPTGVWLGTDVFRYEISDGRGGVATGTVQVTVVKDTFAPVASSLHAWIAAGTVHTTATITLTWKGTDQGLGVKYYQLQEKKNNGTWVWVTIPVGHASINRVVSIGIPYQYRVRAIDQVGNVGPFTYLANFTPTLVQETAATYAGPWTHARLVGALGGYVSYASTHGSFATFTCTCMSMAWIAPKGTTLSTSRVYFDGTLIGIYSEKATKTTMYQVIFAKTGYGIAAHSMTVSVTGAGRVEIDAFLTLQ